MDHHKTWWQILLA